MAGYSIRKLFQVKNNRKAILLICLGVLFEICAAGLEYKQIMDGVAEAELKYKIVSPYSPFIVPASICIFSGFALLDLKKEFGRLSEITFFIYLIHAGVWDFICKVSHIAYGKNFLVSLDCRVWILLFVSIVFWVSCLLSRLYIWIWNKLDKNSRITDCLVCLFECFMPK